MSRLSQTMTSSFLSTPSARRATSFSFSNLLRSRISIHALREEGDPECRFLQDAVEAFLSTPSARRATSEQFARLTAQKISIHALREEGDLGAGGPLLRVVISIHALREEGDTLPQFVSHIPRIFLSTPSARRATSCSASAA